MNRRLIAALLVVAAALVVAHTSFFYFRDNFSTHYPLKVYSAEAYRAGEIPFWNHAAGGGQALAGNPNLLTFYPDNLLYLLFPAQAAFNLHFLIHLAIAFLAMRRLCRAVSLTVEASNVGAALYLLSGVVVSTAAFYNLVVAVALVPLLFAQLHGLIADPRMKQGLFIGVTAGLLGLAGEPTMIAATGVAALFIVAGKERRPLVPPLAFAAVIALLVVSPQLITYREISTLTERSFQKFSTQSVMAASLGPWRLAEMIFGPFLGVVTNSGTHGYNSVAPFDHRPVLFISVFLSFALIPALVQRLPAHLSRYRWLAVVFLFIALGRHNPLIVAIVDAIPQFHLARYPEKLVIHAGIAAAVLVAAWLEQESSAWRDRAAAAVTPLLGIVLIALAVATLPAAAVVRLAGGVIVSAILFLVLLRPFTVQRRRLTATLLFAAALSFLIGAFPIDWARLYHPDGGTLAVAAGKRVWRMQRNEASLLNATGAANVYPHRAAGLDPLFGVAHGVRYALDRSPEGMYSYLSRVVAERAGSTPVPIAIRYAQLAGCELILSRFPLEDSRLRLRSRSLNRGLPLHAYALRETADYVGVARRAITTASVNAAVAHIEGEDFRVGDVTLPPSVAMAGPAVVANVRRGRGRVSFDIDAPQGAVVVINEGYAPAWSVSAERSLRTFPANIDRLGVSVPPGRYRVEAVFGNRRGTAYFALALSFSLFLFAVVLSLRDRLRSTNDTAAPAR